MALLNKRGFFFNYGRRFSIGCERNYGDFQAGNCIHVNAGLFGIGLTSKYYCYKLWIGLWPRIPLIESESLYKYSKEFRFCKRIRQNAS